MSATLLPTAGARSLIGLEAELPSLFLCSAPLPVALIDKVRCSRGRVTSEEPMRGLDGARLSIVNLARAWNASARTRQEVLHIAIVEGCVFSKYTAAIEAALRPSCWAR